MPDVRDFLGAQHSQFKLHEKAWKREERRQYGADAVLTASEFPKWRGEDSSHYDARVAQARYLNFPDAHAAILAGHLARARPTGGNFSLGTMGEVRERSKLEGRASVAELFYYNVDGIGSSGTELPAWTDGIQRRAIGTGHRWCMVEMPALADIRGAATSPTLGATQADVLRGFRPYAVEYSPLRVPIWEIDRGRLDWAVVRVPVSRSRVENGKWKAPEDPLGFYLLVREGFAGLGDEYDAGGWWLFDSDMKPLAEALNGGAPIAGTWERTRGEIPLFTLIAQDSQGTEERPAMSRSLTMELGQLAIGLMNRISEREYDAADAARSVKFILGTDPENPKPFNLTVDMLESGALVVPVPAWHDKKGDAHSPTIYDSSSGAIAADVYQRIVDSAIAEAREIMVRQVTSTPDSSGVSKEAGFAEATSPLLSTLAAHRQRFENTLIYFAELRAGASASMGYSMWRRDFNLRDVVGDIDEGLDTLKRSGLRSKTAEVSGVLTVLTEKGIVSETDRDTVKDELEESAAQRVAQEEADRALFEGTRARARAERDGAVDGAVPEAGDEERTPTERTPTGPERQPGEAPVAADVGLNGAQITAALEVIHSLRNQDPALRIAPVAATELLVALGIPVERANVMVQASLKDLPPVLDPATTPETPAPNGRRPPAQEPEREPSGRGAEE